MKEVLAIKTDKNAVTKKPRIYYCQLDNGKFISIIYTPGFPLINYNCNENKENFLNLVININSKGVQLKGILFLSNILDEKIEFDPLIILNTILPNRDFWKHLLIIFTHFIKDPDYIDDSFEEIKRRRYETDARIFQSIISKDKKSLNIEDYEGIRKIYLNLYCQLSNKKELKLRKEEKNIKVIEELKKEIKEMIFMNSIFTNVEIVHDSNYEYIESGKNYLLDVILIGFFDSFGNFLKEIKHIISKREVNQNEFNKDKFKKINIIKIGESKEDKGEIEFHTGKESKENCSLI